MTMPRKEREKIEDRVYYAYTELEAHLQTEIVDNIVNLDSLRDSLHIAGKNTAAFIVRDAINKLLKQEQTPVSKEDFLDIIKKKMVEDSPSERSK